MQRLVNSFGQDMIFSVTGGRQMSPKHILLPYAVKSLTVEPIEMLNRFGNGIAYSQIEELNTALCLLKMVTTPENAFPLPDNIQPYTATALAWDKFDRLQETLSGDTEVNCIGIQPRQFGPHHPPPEATPNVVK